ncbi:MAG: trehalose-phosphatase [Candidatus Eisenbacteria bacterium]|nr:trehalose-phosphatase [Candidatus Eisenbacteria bacterium]
MMYVVPRPRFHVFAGLSAERSRGPASGGGLRSTRRLARNRVVVDSANLTYPRHVTEEVDLLSRALGGAYRIFLFADYGGTLVPNGTESDVAPPSLLLSRLEKLAGVDSVSLFVMSGKTVDDLDASLGLDGVGLIGQGGYEIRKPGGETVCPVNVGSARRLLHRLELEAHGTLSEYPGVRVDNKGFAVSVRHAACDRPLVGLVTRSFSGLVRSLDEHHQLELLYRDDGVEARLGGWRKGDALRHILRDADPEDSLAICIGDDVTDEEAFEAVLEWSDDGAEDSIWMIGDPDSDEDAVPTALPILVSPTPRPTLATLFVRGPHEVYEFLSSMSAVATALL